MNANILIKFESGLGDTYSTLVSALETFQILEKHGYETNLVIDTRKNPYFSQEHKLDFLFNLSEFKNNVVYNVPLNKNGYPDIENIFGTKRIVQKQKSYHIFLSEEIDELRSFESNIYGHPEIRNSKKFPNCNVNLLSEEVLKLADKISDNKSNMVGIHFRPLDENGDNESELERIKEHLEFFTKKYHNKNFFVGSNGNLIKNYLSSNLQNLITTKFTYQNIIPFYPCYIVNQKGLKEEDFILHAQEIASEMSFYRNCEKIISFSYFLSNFITYGILNNKHNKIYEEIIEN